MPSVFSTLKDEKQPDDHQKFVRVINMLLGILSIYNHEKSLAVPYVFSIYKD
jgi:hypothetical protein